METRHIALAAAIGAAAALNAQDTYQNAAIMERDLNGTARYVGMGGAMDALGADISTIGTNPAGIGLFRHSVANVSFGFSTQQGAENFDQGRKTAGSFDQAGFVWAMRSGRNSYLNFAFNYHKSQNFNQIMSAANRLGGASQNKLTYMKLRNGNLYRQGEGQMPIEDEPYVTNNQLDYIYYNNLTKYQYEDGSADFGYYDAEDYSFDGWKKGHIGQYDFNISGNIHDKVFLGFTFGFHDVHYRSYGEYRETLAPNADNIGGLTVGDTRQITGSGFDVKAGLILRPVDSSPFRVGLSVATPTWYSLHTYNNTYITDGGHKPYSSESYDFKLYTPWKFGLAIGHTFGSSVAVGAGYDYAGYGSMDTRAIDSEGYDGWTDEYYEYSSSEPDMNRHTGETLAGVSTLKVGAEVKVVPEVAFRIGYNYVSPMYKEDGFKDGTVDALGSYYSSSTAYTNWKATNRLTFGVGMNFDRLDVDFAYQYSGTDGVFKPFMDGEAEFQNYDAAGDPAGTETLENFSTPSAVSLKRHQALLTLTYHF